MLPYYYNPFGRKNVGVPAPPIPLPTEQPAAMPPVPQEISPVQQVMPPAQPMFPVQQPVAPVQPVAPMQPVMPIQQTMPIQPMCPVQQPVMSMQPMMPVCPVQQPVMPVCPYLMGPQTMPSQAMPGMGMMGMSGMDEMMGMDMMDMGGMDEMMGMGEFAPPATSDPPPVLSDNPAVARTVLYKELTGYPNYGNPSGNADILYTGNRGTWTFDIPGYLFSPGNQRAQLLIHAVLDDHYNVPVNLYSARIAINNVNVHTGPLPLPHGAPSGQRFTNWQTLTFNITNLRRNTRIVITNTSTAGANDWVAFDWMELRLMPR